MNVQNSGKPLLNVRQTLGIGLPVKKPYTAAFRRSRSVPVENPARSLALVGGGVENQKAPPGCNRTRPDQTNVGGSHG